MNFVSTTAGKVLAAAAFSVFAVGAYAQKTQLSVYTALESPDHLLVVAAGGPSGGFGAIIPPWMGHKTKAVTAAIGVCVDCEPGRPG